MGIFCFMEMFTVCLTLSYAWNKMLCPSYVMFVIVNLSSVFACMSEQNVLAQVFGINLEQKFFPILCQNFEEFEKLT